jgi:hypothetical protein
MTDGIFPGFSRRIHAFEYNQATMPAIDRIVEESRIRGMDAADAIVELALPTEGSAVEEDVSWTYGSASPPGQGAEVGTPLMGEEDLLSMTAFGIAGFVDPGEDDEADREPGGDSGGDAGGDVADVDMLDDVGDALDELEEQMAPDAAPPAPRHPGEADIF